MRQTLVRIGYLFAIVFIGEAILAIGFATTLEIFRLWIGVTSVFLLVGAVLTRFGGSAGRLSDMQMANYQVSSGTKPLWDMSRPLQSERGQGAFPVAFGTSLALGAAFLLMFFLL